VFQNTAITTITIPASVTSIGGSIADIPSTTFILEITTYFTVKDNLLYTSDETSILGYFSDFTSSSYIIPASVTSIGDYAFRSYTTLILITIPASVTSIGDRAFQSCSSLTTVSL
jgi:hypothetical protein